MAGRAWQAKLRPDLSPECRDLLTRMLDPDPDSRASMPDIMGHPWFVADLDTNVMMMHVQALAQRPKHRPAQQPEEIRRVVKRVCEGPRGPQPQHLTLC
jgi:serine/threonine-protein kinase SRK2